MSAVAIVRCTVIVARMSPWKWRETKQRLILWPDTSLLGCCLVSLHFQCYILATITVLENVSVSKKDPKSLFRDGPKVIMSPVIDAINDTTFYYTFIK